MAQGLYDQIKAHALGEAPQECCGIVAMDGDQAVATYRAANVAQDPQLGYLMDTDDQWRILRELPDGGVKIAIYHSHPTSGPEPSLRDLRQAAYPDAIYLIVGMKQGLVTKAWRFGNTALPVALEIV